MVLPANATACAVINILLAGASLFYTQAPRGFCNSCCQITEKKDISFLLYTRKNPDKPDYLLMDDDKRLASSHLDKSLPLAIYFHGFTESTLSDTGSSQRMKNGFLKAGNYNVILVDWSPITAAPWYSSAVENMPVPARYSARFIYYLISRGFPVSQIHVVGFSLGGEIAGFVGHQLKDWGVRLPRITALDPALPLFDSLSGKRHLKSSAARFVDVIHTDGGVFGNPAALGHADFYPNGGHAVQPGCAREEIENKRIVAIFVGCSHERAWKYFIETLLDPFAFPAQSCEPSELFGPCREGKRAYMGIGADKGLRGRFQLNTNDKPPFGRNAKNQALRPLEPVNGALAANANPTPGTLDIPIKVAMAR